MYVLPQKKKPVKNITGKEKYRLIALVNIDTKITEYYEVK